MERTYTDVFRGPPFKSHSLWSIYYPRQALYLRREQQGCRSFNSIHEIKAHFYSDIAEILVLVSTGQTSNYLRVLDTSTYSWTLISETHGLVPKARAFLGMASAKGKLYIFGGKQNSSGSRVVTLQSLWETGRPDACMTWPGSLQSTLMTFTNLTPPYLNGFILAVHLNLVHLHEALWGLHR